MADRRDYFFSLKNDPLVLIFTNKTQNHYKNAYKYDQTTNSSKIENHVGLYYSGK